MHLFFILARQCITQLTSKLSEALI